MQNAERPQEPQIRPIFSETSARNDHFTTDLKLIEQRWQEEQAFYSFEQALRARWQQPRAPGENEAKTFSEKPPANTSSVAVAADPPARPETARRLIFFLNLSFRRVILLVCLVLLLLMIGFDLMGFLVLFAHLR